MVKKDFSPSNMLSYMDTRSETAVYVSFKLEDKINLEEIKTKGKAGKRS